MPPNEEGRQSNYFRSFMKDNTERNVDKDNKIFLEEQSGFKKGRSCKNNTDNTRTKEMKI
jgi:hypothetical protein